MRLWHFELIQCLDRQRLLGQHRECCALRGLGWCKNHSTVNYVYNHAFERLVKYHFSVMHEMEKRGYKVDSKWWSANYRGKILGFSSYLQPVLSGKAMMTPYNYPEHDDKYLNECKQLLIAKNPEYYSKIFNEEVK